MKRRIKSLAQHAVATLAPSIWRLRREPRLLVLMYHRVLPAGHPDRSFEQPGMYVSPETLAMHLDVLSEYFSLVHLDDWIAQAQAGDQLPGNACAITFDDGWRDNYEYAYPVLKHANAPATIYLVSDLVGTRYSFWPNSLARILAAHDKDQANRMPDWLRQLLPGAGAEVTSLDSQQIDSVICACKATRTDAVMHAAIREVEGGDSAFSLSQRDLMSWAEIREMKSGGLVRFGSHTRRHTRLSGGLSLNDLRDEVLGSRQVIEEHLGVVPKTFCYPNGDTSPEAVECVRSAYMGAVTTAHGWSRLGEDPFTLNRVGVHEDVSRSRVSFLSRIAGVG